MISLELCNFTWTSRWNDICSCWSNLSHLFKIQDSNERSQNKTKWNEINKSNSHASRLRRVAHILPLNLIWHLSSYWFRPMSSNVSCFNHFMLFWKPTFETLIKLSFMWWENVICISHCFKSIHGPESNICSNNWFVLWIKHHICFTLSTTIISLRWLIV